MTGPTYLDDDEQMYFDPADAGAFVAAVARGDHQTAREVVGWDAPAEDLEALADRLALSSTPRRRRRRSRPLAPDCPFGAGRARPGAAPERRGQLAVNRLHRTGDLCGTRLGNPFPPKGTEAMGCDTGPRYGNAIGPKALATSGGGSVRVIRAREPSVASVNLVPLGGTHRAIRAHGVHPAASLRCQSFTAHLRGSIARCGPLLRLRAPS
jgi:hypothetical protein